MAAVVMAVVFEFSVMRCQPLRRALYLIRFWRYQWKNSNL
ncbi:acetyltransferase, partial [Vibrio mimicus]